MHLHRLEFQAIGPFAGRHVIDFDALSGNGAGGGGLFLLEGPTGSGKSTVIDALTFALFGSTAGSATGEARIRSTHVAPQVETYVDLVVSVARGTFRFRRTPAYQRPKLRGSGTTEEKASATLWRLSEDELATMAAGGPVPDGTHLLTGAREVGQEAEGLIGLTREQFAQTVVLPQGEFARFLRSTSDERERILQRVFGTEVYQRVQERLRAQAAACRKELERAEERLRARVDGYVAALPAHPGADTAAGDTAAGGTAAGDTEDEAGASVRAAAARLGAADEREAGAGADALAEAITRIDARLAARTGALVAEQVRTRAAADAARRAQRREEQLAEALARRVALLARRAEHTRAAPEVEALAQALAAAERADRVTPFDRAATAAARRVRAARTELTDLPGAADLPLEDPDALVARAEAEVAEVERLDRERGALRHAHDLEQGLPARQEAHERRQADLGEQRAALSRQRADLDARPARRATIAERRAVALASASDEADAATAAQEARARHGAAQDAARAEAEVGRAREALALATEQTTRASEATHELRRRRIAGIAGELASGLVDGEPCTVCGARSHPAPARPADDHPDVAQVEAAETAARATDEAQTDARSHLDVAVERLEALRERSGGLTVTEAQVAAQQADATLAAAREAARTASTLEAELATFDERTTDLESRARDLEREVDAAAVALDKDRDTLDADRRTCAAARGGEETVDARVRSLDADRASRARRAAGARALAEALRQAESAEADLATALTEQGFAGIADAHAARLPDDALAGARRRLEAHATEGSVVAEQLAAPEIAALTGEESPDVEGAARATQEAGAADEAAVAALATAREAADRAARLGAELLTEARGQLALRARIAPFVRVADLATASSRSLSQVTLSTWVLMRRFEDMLAAANGRLRTMSSGRYELQRTDRDESRRPRHAGLGLAVVDHQTETRRPPATLSGGETFYVSLALALGLADVVRSEAGGIDIGTLLIDEGFGSLDQDTLDTVMNELTVLRDAGRTVGLVSHVTEMQRMIPDQIRVRRLDGRGSTLEVNWMR